MNFYKHYIGDFQRDTGHLSLTERGAYLALMQHYYATEQALPVDHAALCRIAGAFSKPERDAVKSVLCFFEKRDGLLWHKRIEAELEKQEGRADTNRRIALEREARKRAEKEAEDEHESTTNRAPDVPETLHEQSTNQNHIQNQSPGEKKPPAPPWITLGELQVDGLSEEVGAAWLAHRRARKAKLTALAWSGFKAEVEKAGWSIEDAVLKAINRNWTSVEAEWLTGRPRQGAPVGEDEIRAERAKSTAGAAKLLGFNTQETIDG